MQTSLGISLFDLFSAPSEIQNTLNQLTFLPPEITRFINDFQVLSYTTAIADDYLLHSGIVLGNFGTSNMDDPNDRNAPVIQVPALTSGLPFRLFVKRPVPDTSGVAEPTTVEKTTGEWTLQIDVPEARVRLPFKSAQYVAASQSDAPYLEPFTENDPPLTCSMDAGIIEITSRGQFRALANFSLGSDTEESLFVRFRTTPADFYLTTDDYAAVRRNQNHLVGMRLGEVILDFSKGSSPPEARRAGFGDAWMGAYVQEISVFLPRSTPFIVPKVLTLRDALIGDSFAGKAIVEFGNDTNSLPKPIFKWIGEDGQLKPVNFGENDKHKLIIQETQTITKPPYVHIIAFADVNSPWRVNDPEKDRTPFARWLAPDGQIYQGAHTPPIKMHPGDQITYSYAYSTKFEPPPPQMFTLGSEGLTPQATLRFQLKQSDSTPIDNVLFISAGKVWLDQVELSVTHPAASSDFTWTINFEPPVRRVTYPLSRLNIGNRQRVGVWADGYRHYLIIDVLEGAATPLIVTFNDQQPPAQVKVLQQNQLGKFVEVNRFQAINTSYHLPTALGYGTLRQMTSPVPTIDAGGSLPSLQPSRLYEVIVTAITGSDTPHPTSTPAPRPTMISLFFATDDARNPLSGLAVYTTELTTQPSPKSGTDLRTVQELLGDLESGQIYVVGRASRIGSDRRNNLLDTQRAATTRSLLNDIGLGSFVQADRGEFDAADNWPLGLGTQERAQPSTSLDHSLYQRADIYIFNAQWKTPEAPTTPTPTTDGVRPILVPGVGTPVAPAVPTLNTEGRIRRLRLEAEWNRDPFPTKAEIQLSMNLGDVPVPIDGQSNESRDPPYLDLEVRGARSHETDLLRILLRLVYDQRSKRGRWTGMVDNAGDADGLVRASDTKVLGLLLLFGPILAKQNEGVADPTARAVTAGVSAATLLGLTAAVTSANIINNVNWILNGVTFELDHKDDTVDAVRLTLDYSVEFEVAIHQPFNIGTHDQPVRTRYRNIGLEVRPLKSGEQWWEALTFLFDPATTAEVERSGNFRIDGPLGDLLQVVGMRLGHGSTFLDLDMAFALDLGVVTLSRATLRIKFDGDPPVELRGLRAGVNVPGTIEGSGGLTIGAGGSVAGELDLRVIPADLRVAASLAIEPKGDYVAVALAIDAELPTGIPLAGSGLGIYGFLGRFAANMQRQLGTEKDPVTRELKWAEKILDATTANIAWLAQRDHWGFGVGVVIGSLPDGGRLFTAKGALVLALPGPTVVFAIAAKFVQTQRDSTRDKSITSNIVGLVRIDEYSILIGVEGKIDVGGILTIDLPVSAYFPFAARPPAPERDAYYLRIGSDGVTNVTPSRAGRPVSVQLNLTDLGSISAYTFLMLEERGLQKLGGDGELNFYGFSIGFGLGVEIRLGSDPIELRASAKLLAGLGTAPFALVGKLHVEGSLKLLIVSIGISSKLDFRHDTRGTVFKGQFCISVGFLFFSISACIDIQLGDGDPYTVLPPPDLISGMGLMDRRGQQIADAVESTGLPRPTAVDIAVWPDIVPVLHIAHAPATQLDAASPFSGQLTSTTVNPEVWVGDYLYHFTLTDLRLEVWRDEHWVAVRGTPDPLQAAWWFPSHRPAFLENGAPPPSGEEARELGLLSWHPAPWGKVLAGARHEPTLLKLEESIANLCLPAPTWSDLPEDKAFFKQSRAADNSYEWQALSENGQFTVQIVQRYGGEPLPQALERVDQDGKYYRPAVLEQEIGLRLAGAEQIEAVKTHINVTRQEITEITPSVRLQYDSPVVTPTLTIKLSQTAVYPQIFLEARDGVSHEAQIILDDFSGTVQYAVASSQEAAPFLAWRIESYRGQITVIEIAGRHSEAQQSDVAFLRNSQQDTSNAYLWQVKSEEGYFFIEIESLPAAIDQLDHNNSHLPVVNTGVPGGLRLAYFEQSENIETETKQITAWGMTSTTFDTRLIYSSPQLTPTLTIKVSHPDLAPQVFLESKVNPNYAVPVSRNGDILVYSVENYHPDIRFIAWRIEPYRGEIILLDISGRDAQAAEYTQHQHQLRQSVREALVEHSQASRHPTQASQNLLEANSHYRVSAIWQWRGYHKATPDKVGESRQTQFFEFKTASENTNADAITTSLDQSVFDARALRSYVVKQPALSDPPLFLDDALGVGFAVDHLEGLLECYGRTLQLAVVRTDTRIDTRIINQTSNTASVPSISTGITRTGLTTDNRVPYAVAWQRLQVDAVDQRLVERFANNHCTTGAQLPLGGIEAILRPQLAPQAQYDLIVYAPKFSDDDAPKKDNLILRATFVTSRYRSPDELFAALGFGSAEQPGTEYLADRFILKTNALPDVSPARLGDDLALEQALRALGVDEMTIPTEPTVTAFWCKDAGQWAIVALLLDAPEPLHRSGRMEVIDAQLGGVSLQVVRSAQSGTRLLFAAQSPVALSQESLITLKYQEDVPYVSGDSTTMKSVYRWVSSKPLQVLWEE